MTRTVAEAIAWAKRHPTKDVGETDDSWSGWCAALVYWAGGFDRSFPYALDAAEYARWRHGLFPDWRRAPAGAIHYWGGVWINGRENGHVAIDTGNDHTLLMASSRVSNFGNGIGTIRFADYGLPNYLGWSTYWGDERLQPPPASPAGKPPTIITIPEEEDDMTAIKFGHRSTGGDEWMLVHPDLRGELPHERGLLVTTDQDEATAWGRTHAKGSNDYDFDVPRDEYIDIQRAAQRTYDAKTRAEKARRA